jgi:hypothetical protein
MLVVMTQAITAKGPTTPRTNEITLEVTGFLLSGESAPLTRILTCDAQVVNAG